MKKYMTVQEAVKKMDEEGVEELPFDAPRNVEMAEVPVKVLDVDNQIIVYLVKVYSIKNGKRDGGLRYMFMNEDSLQGILQQVEQGDKSKESYGMYA